MNGSNRGDLKRSIIAAHIVRPFQDFAKTEAFSGVLLLLCTIAALLWVNSPFAASYEHLWEIPVSVGWGSWTLEKALHVWINDGLMVIFFLLVGLEIKREILVGELSSMKHAALPVMAAVGGMLFPALIYSMLNRGTAGAGGWAVPMATDIAFALSIMSLLGKRVPLGLKVFLTAFAIVDDIGAVLVIALFYHAGINVIALVAAGVILLALVVANAIGIRHLLVYTLLGIALWLAFLASGLHTTIAGILLAMTIPARVRGDAGEFLEQGRVFLDTFEKEGPAIGLYMNEQQQSSIQALETAAQQSLTPLQRMEHGLNPWVSYLIVPLFALANAGVPFKDGFFSSVVSLVSLGVMIGLIVGKQMGIMLFAWLAIKLGWAELPEGTSWLHLYGASWLGGVGFTMALFIAGLAFGDNEVMFNQARSGILMATLVAGLIGWAILMRCGSATRRREARSMPGALVPSS